MEFFLWLLLVFWLGTELWIALREWGKTSNAQDRRTKQIFAFCAAAAISIGLIGPRPPAYTIRYSRSLMLFLGSVTMLSGIFVRAYSVRALGDFFRTTVMVVKGQKLIQTGLYKYVRHPSYTGTLVTVLGFGIALDNAFTTLLMLVVMLYGVHKRVIVEEDVMERSFGKAYTEYKTRTKKLIPNLY